MSPISPHRAYIGLGSNLDNPRTRVIQALEALDRLPLTCLAKASRLYLSRPVGPQDQPDFINAVAALHTRLSPLALLDQLQALEQQHRRRRMRHWGPRTLDLDLLLFDTQELALPRLCVPHPHIQQRGFVLLPLQEIAPTLSIGERPLHAWLAALPPEEIPQALPLDTHLDSGGEFR